MSDRPQDPFRGGSGAPMGAVLFAASMMLLIGAFQAIAGLVAIIDDAYYVVTPNYTFDLDVTGWGWIHLVVGLILIGVGIGLFRGALWAAITASVLVLINMISQMFLLPAYPIWSIVIIALDAFVLYALTVHGDERISDL